MSVIGLDSLRFFWSRRTSEGTARDVTALIEHYTGAWQRRRIVLIGYSFGADVLPFVVNRLPRSQRSRVAGVALLGPSPSASFEFHVASWACAASGADALPVVPEVERLSATPVLCVYGEQETDSICPRLTPGLAQALAMKGGHHFGGDYRTIAQRTLDLLR